MALILNIDTALEKASVCLAQDGMSIALAVNDQQKDHAAWIHTAIRELLQSAGKQVGDLQAIGISAGPGSYTGLRVGMSTAKGLCYALQLPLISIGTLQVMAQAALTQVNPHPAALLCPMIDARRMEVFTAVYDQHLQQVAAPHAMIIDGDSFLPNLNEHSLLFFGNGSEKLKAVLHHPRAVFLSVTHSAADMAALTALQFSKKAFADLAYAEPLYVKAFYTPIKH